MKEDPLPVVLLIYGDHNPAFIPSSVYDEGGVSFDLNTEDGFLRYYGTPYCIWANEAARAKLPDADFSAAGPTISPCYLMNVLFRTLGWKGDTFMQFTDGIFAHVPVINTNGYYYEDGVFTHELSDEGATLVEQHRIVQYYLHKVAPG